VAKIKLPYVNRVMAKGRFYYRYRREGMLISLPCDPSMPEFMDAYYRIHASFEKPNDKEGIGVAIPGSIAELIADFKKSAEFMSLSPRTKELYLAHLDDISDRFGKFQIRSMTRNVVMTYRDSLLDNPGKANNALKVLSRLYSFAIDRDKADVNPVSRVKKLKLGSYRPWTLEEIGKFRTKAAPHMRLALNLALYTGQRQSDVLKMRWEQIKDGGIEVRQQKTGKELWIPLHKNLQTEINQLPRTGGTILVTVNGKAYGNRDWFSAEWKKTSREAGLPEDCVFHGLRKTAAVFLAEAGCTNEQIKAITGHTTETMVAYYTRGANQRTLAREAMTKFEQKLNSPKP
jgi:integrase